MSYGAGRGPGGRAPVAGKGSMKKYDVLDGCGEWVLLAICAVAVIVIILLI